ncbi:hypothetical protein AB205_0023630, partial [Aquarana catesbeiana]
METTPSIPKPAIDGSNSAKTRCHLNNDPSCEIRKVVKFLGKDFSEEVVERICQHTSFKAMKENPLTNYTSLSSTIMDQSIS